MKTESRMALNDDKIDSQLQNYVSKEGKKSFFLFAGAGSGKTRSLVKLLAYIESTWGDTLTKEHRQVAVITYTNAATDEIIRRLEFSPIFHVSTIHSFLWDVIKTFQVDIKKYYLQRLQNNIDEIEAKLANPRSRSYNSNLEKCEYYKNQKSEKEKIKRFIYNPNGDNLKTNSLNHQDVIDIGIKMITENNVLQRIIVQQYPFMMIDESQDTKSGLVDALFKIQQSFSEDFTLGFIGDIKQRIYADGKVGIKDMIPDEWEQPTKIMNYRCAKRIVELANKISAQIDASLQQPRKNAPEGYVRLFLIENKDGLNKQSIEAKVCEIMEQVTSDNQWRSDVKVLTLEHRMAAVRLGFKDFYELFYNVPKYKMSFLQGEIPEMSLFSNNLFPLFSMIKEGNETGVLSLLKKTSPLLEAVADKDYPSTLKEIKIIIDYIKTMNPFEMKVSDIISFVHKKKLFTLPAIILEALNANGNVSEDDSPEFKAWVEAMQMPLVQIKMYDDYVNDRTSYATHQGVKGLEFPRVMVLIDDNEAKGYSFSYDKLFEVVPLSPTDIKNRELGKENTIDRTSRLFYVTCTRAKESLAIVMYTTDPEKAKETAINNDWFTENEIQMII